MQWFSSLLAIKRGEKKRNWIIFGDRLFNGSSNTLYSFGLDSDSERRARQRSFHAPQIHTSVRHIKFMRFILSTWKYSLYSWIQCETFFHHIIGWRTIHFGAMLTWCFLDWTFEVTCVDRAKKKKLMIPTLWDNQNLVIFDSSKLTIWHRAQKQMEWFTIFTSYCSNLSRFFSLSC